MPSKLGIMPKTLGSPASGAPQSHEGAKMSSRSKPQPLLIALLLAFCFVPGLSVVASLWWLKQQPDELVFLITAIAAIVTIAASLALSIVHDRRMDEVERSNSRFASFWGDAAG